MFFSVRTLNWLFLIPSVVQYHIGHLHCLLGQTDKAKKTFEDILSSKAVPNSVKAMTLRQLGKVTGGVKYTYVIWNANYL